MRNVMNISLPPELAKEIEDEVRKGNFASKSEFIRHVLRERKLLKELEVSQQQFIDGKGKKLHSLKELRS